jgi:hypothetical protein
MSGYQFVMDTEAAAGAGATGITTGVHKCKVLGVEHKTDAKGNPKGDIYLEEVGTGNRAIIFGLMLAPKWHSGADNLEYKKWMEFAQVCGMQTGAIAAQPLQVSKEKNEQRNCFSECTGKIINVAIQEKLDVYNNEESKDKTLNRTFMESGQSIAEAAINGEAKQIEYVRTNLKPYETKAYKTWKANGGQPSSETPAPEENAAAAAAAADLV